MAIPSFQPATAASCQKNSGASSHVPKAIRRCSVSPETIGKFCGRKEGALCSMVNDGLLPENFSFSRSSKKRGQNAFQENSTLPDDQKFFRIAKLAHDLQEGKDRTITATDVALIGIVAPQIEKAAKEVQPVTPQEKWFSWLLRPFMGMPLLILAQPKVTESPKHETLLYGKTPQEWADAAGVIFGKLKSDVERAVGYRERAMVIYYQIKYTNEQTAERIMESLADGGGRTMALLEKCV